MVVITIIKVRSFFVRNVGPKIRHPWVINKLLKNDSFSPGRKTRFYEYFKRSRNQSLCLLLLYTPAPIMDRSVLLCVDNNNNINNNIDTTVGGHHFFG